MQSIEITIIDNSIPGRPYSLGEDHKAIKEQIKEWEIELDKIIMTPNADAIEIKEILEAMSHEMMSINL